MPFLLSHKLEKLYTKIQRHKDMDKGQKRIKKNNKKNTIGQYNWCLATELESTIPASGDKIK